MLDPKGNTAVYVLYAYARIAGVLRRAEHDVSSLSSSDLVLTEPSDTWRQERSRTPQIVSSQQNFHPYWFVLGTCLLYPFVNFVIMYILLATSIP